MPGTAARRGSPHQQDQKPLRDVTPPNTSGPLGPTHRERRPARLAAVAAIVLAAIGSLWFEIGAVRELPRLLTTTSSEGLAVLWRRPTSGKPKGFAIAVREIDGWPRLLLREGRYRAAALRGDDLLVFFKESNGRYAYSVYRQAKRSPSSDWPCDWEPRAAAAVGQEVWALGADDDVLRCARMANEEWTQAPPIAGLPGRPVFFSAMAEDGRPVVSVFTHDPNQRTADLALYEWQNEQWRRTPVWSSAAAPLQVAALRSAQGIWRVTLEERLLRGCTLDVHLQRDSSDPGQLRLSLRRVRDFALVPFRGRPLLVVVLPDRLEAIDLTDEIGHTREIIHERDRFGPLQRFLGAIATTFLLVLVVLAAARFAWHESQHSVPLEEGQVVLASLGRRVAAWLIDYVLTMLLAFIVGLLFFENVILDETSAVMGFLTVLQTCRLVYTTGFEFGSGQTPGKRLTRIRVITLGGFGPGFGASLIRNLLRGIDEALFIGLTVMLWTPRMQRIGDLLARTIVIRSDVLSDRIMPEGQAEAPGSQE